MQIEHRQSRVRVEPPTQTGLDHSLGKKLVEALTADADFVPLMRETILGALTASTQHFTKGGGWTPHPDFRVRLDAWKAVMAYAEGLPLVRILKQEIASGNQRSLHEDLRESPALLAAVEKELEKAKFRTRHTKIAQVVSVEIEVPE